MDSFARILVVLTIATLLVATYRVFHACDTPFLAFALIGGAIAHLATRPRRGEVLLTAVLAVCVELAYSLSGGKTGAWTGSYVVAAATALGMASTLVLGFHACRHTKYLQGFLLAACVPLFMIVANLGLGLMIGWTPRVFDHFLFQFDGALGGQPAFWTARVFAGFAPLRDTCFLIYAALPLAYTAWIVAHFSKRVPRGANPLSIFVLAGVLGFIGYQICPGGGPRAVFGPAYPDHPPASVELAQVPMGPTPRNAMPSLHSTWTMLLWWNLRKKKYWNWASGLFLLLTLAATLGFGEHWLIDLIVAVPLSCAVQLAAESRFAPAALGAALTLGWLVYFRFHFLGLTPTPGFAWSSAALTLSAPLLPKLAGTAAGVFAESRGYHTKSRAVTDSVRS